ncbi:hypothetical protein CKAH01_01695 [Colletotrichum kahawae]|nr:hypothetical protein CKAH01_01695 [Colletotrichum kahawae]
MQVRSSMNMQKPGVPSLHLWLAAQHPFTHTLLTESLYRTGSPQTEPASPRQAHRNDNYGYRMNVLKRDSMPRRGANRCVPLDAPALSLHVLSVTPSLLNSSNLTICTLHVPLKQGQQPVHVMWAPALLSPINAHPQRSGTSPSSGTAPSICPVLSCPVSCLWLSRRTCTPSRTPLADPDRQKRSHERPSRRYQAHPRDNPWNRCHGSLTRSIQADAANAGHATPNDSTCGRVGASSSSTLPIRVCSFCYSTRLENESRSDAASACFVVKRGRKSKRGRSFRASHLHTLHISSSARQTEPIMTYITAYSRLAPADERPGLGLPP